MFKCFDVSNSAPNVRQTGKRKCERSRALVPVCASDYKPVSCKPTNALPEIRYSIRVPISPPVELSELVRCLLRDDLGGFSDFDLALVAADAVFCRSGDEFVSVGRITLTFRFRRDFSFSFSFLSFSLTFSFFFFCCLVLVGCWECLLEPASGSREVLRLRFGLGLKSGDGDSTQEAIKYTSKRDITPTRVAELG